METKLLSTDRPIAISYIFQTDLLTYTKVDKSKCTLTFNGDWNLINTTIGTFKIREYPQTDNAGRKFITELSATVPGHDDDTPEEISNINGRKVLLKVEYKSGKVKIIGTDTAAPRPDIEINSSTTTQRTFTATFENTEPNRWLQ